MDDCSLNQIDNTSGIGIFLQQRSSLWFWKIKGYDHQHFAYRYNGHLMFFYPKYLAHWSGSQKTVTENVIYGKKREDIWVLPSNPSGMHVRFLGFSLSKELSG